MTTGCAVWLYRQATAMFPKPTDERKAFFRGIHAAKVTPMSVLCRLLAHIGRLQQVAAAHGA